MSLTYATHRDLLLSAFRYALAGAVNTFVGLAVIIGLQEGLQIEPHLANAAGYAVGVIVSFVLSRFFVFRNHTGRRGAVPRYLAAVAVAFVANQAMLTLARGVLPIEQHIWAVAAQVSGLVTYTATLFLLCRFWVFPAPKVAAS